MCIIPEEIISAYNLLTLKENNVWAYMKICKGMYGLKQAEIIASLLLKNIWKSLVIVLLVSQKVYVRMIPTTLSSH